MEELYHGSQSTDIEILEPRKKSFRDEKEGPVVFATKDKDFASMFIVPTTDDWSIKSGFRGDDFENGYLYVTAISDEERFKEIDKGGAIYTLPTGDFVCERGDNEWTSKNSVKPLRKETYSSGLDAMLDYGVVVYFVSDEDLKNIYSMIEDVSKVMEFYRGKVSENEKRGLENPIQKI